MTGAATADPTRTVEPPKRSFNGVCQDPKPGAFDFSAIQWSDREIKVGPNKGKSLQEAYIRTDRVQDFVEGESLRGSTSFFATKAKAPRAPTDFKRPQANSFISQKTLHCRFGPEDLSVAGPVDLAKLKLERQPHKRIGKVARGESCKRGCQMQFSVSQLALWPEITHIVGKHFDHTNTAGTCCHDLNAGIDSKYCRASRKVKPVIVTKSDDEVLDICKGLIAETAGSPPLRQWLDQQLQNVGQQLERIKAIDSSNQASPVAAIQPLNAAPAAAQTLDSSSAAQTQDGLKQIAAKLASSMQSPGRHAKRAKTVGSSMQQAPDGVPVLMTLLRQS